MVFKGFVFILINIFKQSIRTRIDFLDVEPHVTDNLSHLMNTGMFSS